MGNPLLESDIQARLIARAKSRGVYARKVVATSYRGFPDVLMIRYGTVVFWEVKSLVGRLSRSQINEHKAIRDAEGFTIVTYGLHEAFTTLDVLFPEKT